MAIIQIRHVDENLHEALKVAASCRRVTLNRYVLQAIEVLVTFDAQYDPVVKASLAGGNRSTSRPNGAAISALVKPTSPTDSIRNERNGEKT